MSDLLAVVKQVLSFSLFTLFEHTFTVGELLLLPLVLLLGWWLIEKLAHLATYRLRKTGASADSVHLFKRIFYVIAFAVLIITVLDILNVPLTAFAFLSGAIAIGVGFGAQNIVNNFISGWILMWERPIRIGDFLEVDNARGSVESINTRSTRIRRVDGVHMLIPNSKLLENTVINWTLIDRLTRTSVRVGVAYGSPCRTVANLIEQAASQHEHILKEPHPTVIFDDFGDNALVFEVYFWVNATVERDLRIIRSDVRFAIDELFNDAGIVIAFPQRDVHLDGAITLLPPNKDDAQ
ncbi:mechanosensitive ion channel protein [Alteromonas aestuariivivens]|uniref:Mechanosensitive ion channel protein n=1 Tax=Alteromonas aestuariivivens TaxID=1938339 RepID=A0A3D8M7I2_9ALTE|nr:mechanosensitive ion channel domain-containing protein [Alteromonas aestuariivivens]RDV25507.1 mechanosensitive ion channel protein [Alteromonas aestuariivivens]